MAKPPPPTGATKLDWSQMLRVWAIVIVAAFFAMSMALLFVLTSAA